MPNSTTTPRSAPARLRLRAAGVITAGLAASMALSGMAVASSDTGGSRPDGTVTSAAAHKSDGKEQATPSWVKPVSGDYELSASFGNSGDRWASTHSGQDFAVPIGTDVQAVHGGTVVKAGGNGAGDGPAYGNAIVIKHTDGLYTQYAHLSEIDVTVGQQVSTGDMIGLSGNTGNSSGPHLHFEVRTTPDYGSAVDPVAFLRGEDVTV